MVEYIERNGIIFQIDREYPFRRFGPVALVALVVGGSLYAYGQYQSGKAAEAQGKAQQEILNYNATLKEREAEAERERSRREAIMFAKEGEALKGGQKAAIAKGGVLASEGTPSLLLEQTAMELEADRRQILQEGFLAESFRKSEAAGLRFEGRAAKARGKNIKTASTYKAAGSLLTTIGSASSMGSRMGNVSTTTSGLPKAGTVKPQEGATLARY